MANIDIDLGKYSLGWSDPEKNVFKPEKGLNEDIIRKMSEIKEEPEWMLEYRLDAYKKFLKKPMPEWVAKEKLESLDFDDIYYYIKPTEGQADSWDMVPDEIKETYEKLGIPQAERSYLAGVTAQYESEVVYHKIVPLILQGLLYFYDKQLHFRIALLHQQGNFFQLQGYLVFHKSL